MDMMRLTPEERHRKFLADYDRFYGKGTASAAARAQVLSRPTTSDAKVIQDTFRFIRSEQDDVDDSWEARMARRYYAKLFKEYCIADLSRYKEQKIGMRWRVEKEVVVGKGQFTCGNKRCDARDGLASYEARRGEWFREGSGAGDPAGNVWRCDGSLEGDLFIFQRTSPLTYSHSSITSVTSVTSHRSHISRVIIVRAPGTIRRGALWISRGGGEEGSAREAARVRGVRI